jgi:hypothetical protein
VRGGNGTVYLDEVLIEQCQIPFHERNSKSRCQLGWPWVHVSETKRAKLSSKELLKIFNNW